MPEAPRTGGGFRLYSTAALERLRFINQAQTLGLTLHEVGDLVRYQEHGGVKRCRQVRDLLRAKLDDLQHKLSELEAFKETLAGYLEECEEALAATERTDRRGEQECPVIETQRSKPRGRSPDEDDSGVGRGGLGVLHRARGVFARARRSAGRPVILLLTGVLLVGAFYRVYRPAATACASDGTCPPDTNRRAKVLLWVATAIVMLLVAFPYYVNWLI